MKNLDFFHKISHTEKGMRLSVRKVFTILFVVGLLFFTGFSFARAQTVDTYPNTNLHAYTQDVFLEGLSATGCLLAGIDVVNPHQTCLTNSSAGPGPFSVNNSGLLGTFVAFTGDLYNPPIHTSDFTRDLAANFGVSKAYAQTAGGAGFNSLNPLLTIWKTFRNIAYLIFVIIFVLVGFGIMLRFNIDPRTVMSIENQLPKLVIGLILVTFSFAIAGLLIDLMWLVTWIMVNLLTGINCQMLEQAGKSCQNLPGTVTANIFQDPFGFFNTVEPNGFLGVAFGVGGSLGDVIRGLFTQGNSNQLGGIIPPVNGNNNCTTFVVCGLHDLFTNVVLQDLGSIIGAILSYVISALGMLVVLVVLLVSMFRLWFSLIIAYGFIIFNILMGPFFIVFGMIPNSKVSFGSWIKDLLANLLAFPAVISVLLLGRLVMDAFTINSQALFVPPMIGNPNGQSGGTNAMGFIFGFVTILIAPQAIMLMQQLFGIEPGKLGAALGQSVAGGFGLIINAGKTAGRAYMGRQEYVMGASGKWDRRKWGAAIFGNFLR